MKKNLEIDIPKDSDTEVQRIRGLRKSIFTRTRIALLCFVLVMSLTVAGTLAYRQWSGNQTPNRNVPADVNIHIVEDVNGQELNEDEGSNAVIFGYGRKQVKLTTGSLKNEYDKKARVSFIPQLETSINNPTTDGTPSTQTVSVPFSEKWSDGVQKGNDSDGVERTYVRYGNLVFWLNPDYASKWTYSDGTFTYKENLGVEDETEYLLMGVDWADKLEGVTLTDADKNYTVKVNVIAEAIQENATGTWATETSSGA